MTAWVGTLVRLPQACRAPKNNGACQPQGIVGQMDARVKGLDLIDAGVTLQPRALYQRPLEPMPMRRQLHLNLFVQSRGHHEVAWSFPTAAQDSITDVRYYQKIAQRAEQGLFDSLFFADQLALSNDAARSARIWLEPLTLISALSMVTTRIGLVATASTSYTEPYNLARQFASIDHISGGRAAWNIVTSWLKPVARNFGQDDAASLTDRYAMAEDYVQVVKDLWDSWADDAVIDDRNRKGGSWARPERITAVNHAGPYYNCAGPLNLPRSPQGRPVLVQAGASDAGRAFAARHAEAVFTAHLAKARAQEFYADLKQRIAAVGRDPAQILILPGLNPTIAATEAEAKRLQQDLNEAADPEVGRRTLSSRFGESTSPTCRSTSRSHRTISPIPRASMHRAAAPRWCTTLSGASPA